MANVENVWYKLDFGTGIAKLSYEEPPEGDWKSLKGTIKSKFVIYEGGKEDDKAKKLFSCTSHVSSEHILKPLMVTWDENKEVWIIFYPKFIEFKSWWESNLENVGGSHSQKVELQFRLMKNARKILKDLIQAHTEGVAHGNLKDTSDFAVVEDGKLMLTNFRIRRGKAKKKPWKKDCVADIRDFLTTLQCLNEGYRDNDLQVIIDYLDQTKLTARYKSEHITSFPYWKKPYKRLKFFFDADMVLKMNINLGTDIDTEVVARGAFELSWDANLKGAEGARSSQDNQLEKGLKKVYNNRSRDGESSAGLIEFIRDVFVHATNQGIYEDYDNYLNRKYPGFACIVHWCCFT